MCAQTYRILSVHSKAPTRTMAITGDGNEKGTVDAHKTDAHKTDIGAIKKAQKNDKTAEKRLTMRIIWLKVAVALITVLLKTLLLSSGKQRNVALKQSTVEVAKQWNQTANARKEDVDRYKQKKVEIHTNLDWVCGMQKVEPKWDEVPWKRWFWTQKSMNVQRKWSPMNDEKKLKRLMRLERKLKTMNAVAGGARSLKKRKHDSGTKVFLKTHGMVFELEEVEGNGWCLYESLCRGKCKKFQKAADLRAALAELTSFQNRSANEILSLFQRKNQCEGHGPDLMEARLSMTAHHRKLVSKSQSSSTWGDEMDILLYSLLSHTQVQVFQSNADEIVCVLDSKNALEQLAKEEGCIPFGAIDVENGREQHIYYYPVGKPMKDPKQKGYSRNHYGALHKHEGPMTFPERSWVYEGGKMKTQMGNVPNLRRSKRREAAADRKRKQRSTDEEKRILSDKKAASDRMKRLRAEEKGTLTQKKKCARDNLLRQQKRQEKREVSLKEIELTDANISCDDLRERIASHLRLKKVGSGDTLPFCADANKSLVKALVQFYLNSGCLRFRRDHEYDAEKSGCDLDIAKLLEELEEESVTEDDFVSIMQRFLEAHSYTDSKLLACGACGKRDHEQRDHPYMVHSIDDEATRILQFAQDEEGLLRLDMADPTMTVEVPMDSEWKTMKSIQTWKARSFWEQKMENGDLKHWHLHPELVDTNDHESGHASVTLCPGCSKAIKLKKVPDLSIASGVDFGVMNAWV